MKKKKVETELVSQDNLLMWKVNTVGLLKEILINPGTSILKTPVNIYGRILAQVAERASELNDPIMNGLMCRLAMYEISDPNSKEYDQKLLDDTMQKYAEALKNRKSK
jgi:hypothetical protein